MLYAPANVQVVCGLMDLALLIPHQSTDFTVHTALQDILASFNKKTREHLEMLPYFSDHRKYMHRARVCCGATLFPLTINMDRPRCDG